VRHRADTAAAAPQYARVASAAVTERAICVVGTGLIGGSVVRAAEKAGRTVWGASASEATAAQARADGFDVTTDVDVALRRAAEADALVVLAVPLPALADVLRRVDAVAPTCRLTDAVSVKVAVRDAVARHTPRARFVGGHPMAGTAESGWVAGDADLFTGAAWVVAADDGLDLDVWCDVAELAWTCGARVVPAAAAEHDLAVARVSHLPHLLAALLAATGAESDLPLALAASSFADGTRVAGTRPELVLAMCEGNRDALRTVLDEALGRLGAMREALAGTGDLAAAVRAGHEGRLRWAATREPRGHRVTRDGDAPLAALREIGRRGEAVTGWA
jgi:prephenate dehydrogenase